MSLNGSQPSTEGPAPSGWVVETIIEGRMAWMVKPVPLESYAFTFDLSQAHIFEHHSDARGCAASVWCWHDRNGANISLEVVWLNDEYRAEFATTP